MQHGRVAGFYFPYTQSILGFSALCSTVGSSGSVLVSLEHPGSGRRPGWPFSGHARGREPRNPEMGS
jgi:hypothetical protein